MARTRVRIARSNAPHAREAVHALATSMELPREGARGFLLCFAAPCYDAGELGRALGELPLPAFGCTTAGEISPAGFSEDSLVGAWIDAPGAGLGAAVLEGVDRADFAAGRDTVERAAAALGEPVSALDPRRHVALLLCDGVTGREETLAASIAATMPEISLAGGSAAAGGAYTAAHLFCHGRTLTNAAVLLLLRWDAPFQVLKADHHEPTDARTVVTRADPERRLVFELDGRPAAERYAQLLGLSPETLDVASASACPFACFVDGVPYVRSVSALEGQALRFACAVAEGVVLRLTRATDLPASTARALEGARARLGCEPALLVAFNCLGRYLVAKREGTVGALGGVLASVPVIGFNTYGEQHGGLHINHTLTGVLLGH